MINKDYAKSEIELHKAAQILALTSINLLPKLPDDAQNTFQIKDNKLCARDFIHSNKKFHIYLDLITYDVVLKSVDGEISFSHPMAGSTWDDILSVWSSWLKEIGHQSTLTRSLHYKLPTTNDYNKESFEGLSREFLNKWLANRMFANKVLGKLNQISQHNSEINIWPHHFDTGVYYSLDSDAQGERFSIAAGLATADSLVNEPYFYISGYSRENKINYTTLPNVGEGTWLTEYWQGAVLRLSSLSNSNKVVETFFAPAYNYLEQFRAL